MNGKRTSDARDRDLARGLGEGLEGTYVVEAGAGTGKTTVLVDRLLSLLAAGREIDRIVAITFTEKAAAELRVRLRSELQRAARADGQRENAGAEVPADARTPEERARLRAALLRIDRAEIGTIHSFCARLLRERPVEAGVDPGFGVTDEFERSIILDEALDGWLEDELARGLPPALAEIGSLGVRIEKVRKLARDLVGYRHLFGLIPGPVEVGDADPLLEDLARGARRIEDLAASGCSNADDRALPAIRDFVDRVDAIPLLPDELRPGYVVSAIEPAPKKGAGNKRNWNAGALDEAREVAADLSERVESMRSDLRHNAAVGLLGWLGGFVRSYERAKERAGVLDFDDLLLKARDLVRDNAEVRAHFKRAYDHVLIDEFQDTDPLQCEIAFFLSERVGGRAELWTDVDLEPGKLFIVGDPKQSIYRFRSADVETYERAKEVLGSAGEILRLTENFRTRPCIVGAVNRVFERLIIPPEDGRRYQPDYAPLRPHREEDPTGPGIVILPPPPTLDVKTSAGDARRLEATTVAAFLRWACDSGEVRVFDRERAARGEEPWRPMALRDVGILFHRGRALDEYEDALSDYGLEYRIAGGKRFYARREVRELATVLAAVDDPHDEIAVVGALRSPFLGVSDEAILLHRAGAGDLCYLADGSAGHPDVLEAFSLLRELHARRNDGRIADAVARVLERTGALELFLLKPAGEQRHANLQKIVEIAGALESSRPMGFASFVRWLREITELTPEEGESPMAESGDDFVRILTVHKAKGLEFPITVLADLARSQYRGKRIMVDREAGEMAVSLNAGIATGNVDAFKESERRQSDAEDLRLLYVGATRARDRLVIPWFSPAGAAPKGLLAPLAALLEQASVPVRSLAGESLAVVTLDTGVLNLDRERRNPVRVRTDDARKIAPETTAAFTERTDWEASLRALVERHDRPSRIVLPSALGDHERLTVETPPDDRGAPAAVPGAALGSLVHAVMETVPLDDPAAALPIALAVARAAGQGEPAARDAAALVAAILASPALERARRSRRVWREVPLSLARGGALLEGKIDLLFEEDGGLVVVDYKTDRIDPAGAEEAAGAYASQMRAYALALAAVQPLPVSEAVLVFARAGTEVRVDVAPPGGDAGCEIETLMNAALDRPAERRTAKPSS